MSSSSPAPRRLLIVRNDRVGDLMLTLPAINAARQQWPDVHLAVLASKVAAGLLAGYPGIDEVLVDQANDEAWGLAKRLRPHRFDTAILAHTTWRNAWGVLLAGIPRRIGWGRKLPGMLLSTLRVMVSRSKPPLHETDFVLRLLQPLGVNQTKDSVHPQLPINPVVRQRVSQKIVNQLGNEGPLLGVNPSHFRGAYNWPVERYADLIRELAPHGRVLVTVGPHETQVLEQIRQRWNATGGMSAALSSRIALDSSFNLPELAAAISLVDVFSVGNTGPMHMAGVIGTPLVALFSTHPSQAPDRWRPLGTNHILLQPPLTADGNPVVEPAAADAHMCGIQVADVVAANLEWLRKTMPSAKRQVA